MLEPAQEEALRVLLCFLAGPQGSFGMKMNAEVYHFHAKLLVTRSSICCDHTEARLNLLPPVLCREL